MDLEGRIDVTLVRRGASIASVRIRSSRPQLAQRLLAGRDSAGAADLVGRLFSLCGRSQRAACASACAVAGGAPVSGRETVTAVTAVIAEMALEHVWRLLVDWPKALGFDLGSAGLPDPRVLARLRSEADRADRLAAGIVGVLQVLLGEPPADWLTRSPDRLDQWIDSGGSPAARLLAAERATGSGESRALAMIPALERISEGDFAAIAAAALADPGFCAEPRWHRAPAETGPLARRKDDPFVSGWIAEHGLGPGARLLARLVELARIPGWLAGAAPELIRAAPLEDGAGLAAVETARGLLVHAVRLDAGRITEYRIVAPTEWSCAAGGPLALALEELGPGTDLEQRARRVITAIDPCVECALEIEDA